MAKYLFMIFGITLIGKIQLAHTGEKTLELLITEEYAVAKPFFADFKINQPILHSILENRSSGKVFTDDKENPSFMLVCSPAGYVFLEGDPDLATLGKVGSYLKTLPYVSLVSPLDWKFKHFFEEVGFIAIDRIQFQRPSGCFNLDFWKDTLPVQYSTHRIDKELFPQCNWHSFIISFYGECDYFFANGMGFCFVDQGKIVSESYGLIASDKAEIAVVTDASYRGQNLGTCICAIMLDYCYKHNLEPFWSCNADTPASAVIAKKLGFEEDLRYFFLRWVAPS